VGTSEKFLILSKNKKLKNVRRVKKTLIQTLFNSIQISWNLTITSSNPGIQSGKFKSKLAMKDWKMQGNLINFK
jgi:hypothetical protein